NLGEDSRRFAGNVVEVRCLTADHGTERHERLVSSAPRARFRGDSKLESARHVDHVHTGVLEARLATRGARAVPQPAGGALMVPAPQDCNAKRHGQWARKWPSRSRLASR